MKVELEQEATLSSSGRVVTAHKWETEELLRGKCTPLQLCIQRYDGDAASVTAAFSGRFKSPCFNITICLEDI